MNTGGYDVVVQINEDLINRFLELFYCLQLFPTIKKDFNLPIPNLTNNLKPYAVVGVEVSVDEPPTIDFKSDGNVVFNLRGQAKFKVLKDVTFDIEAEFTAKLKPKFDQTTQTLTVKLVEAKIDDVELDNSYHLQSNVINALNDIIKIVIQDYITTQMTTFPLSPELFSVDLPDTPHEDRLTVGLGNIKMLGSSVMATAVNLLGYTGGNVGAITDFTGGHDIAVGVNEQAMHRVYDHWWQHTNWNKTIDITGSYVFDPPDFVDFLDDLADCIVDALTLFIVDYDVDIQKVWAEYGATLRFSKFSFDLKPNNKVQVGDGSINADIWAKLKVTSRQHVDVLGVTVWEDTSTTTLIDIGPTNITVNIETAEASVQIDSNHMLTVDPETLNITIPLEWDVFEFLLDAVVDWATKQIVDGMPPIVLFPTMLSQKIPNTDATLTLSVEDLTINGTEALVAADISVSHISTYAPYIGNSNSMEVHKRTCEYGKKTKHKVYYCDVEKAIKDGYNGCYYCLPALDTG
jgi:hypothetical protein